ncbi:NnrU family protein [Litoreibacter janthinus]|uniref:Uncharacterized membrane protein n=1 Tax=Litoreibacter janthinus TaxID=670154 RepID=A0A1I6H652_9RHOB|nr:NnrU family protein [Litoreibacter janthinus]SFR49969.1 Uncharacterized membrane protein [Litoreibacter janthinus]
MTWTGFASVFAAFFITHSIPVRPAIKSRIVAKIGSRGFGLAYSTLSLGMLALLIWAAGQAPYQQLWPQMPWQRHVVHLGMLIVCLVLALSIARPNPFSFGGKHNDKFDPMRPGLIRWTRHPILLALALWAGLHLLPNGDLAHVLLFGVLAGFAIAGRWLIDRRKRREMGEGVWIALKEQLAQSPMFYRDVQWSGLIFRLALAITAYTLLILAHPVVIGVPAL